MSGAIWNHKDPGWYVLYVWISVILWQWEVTYLRYILFAGVDAAFTLCLTFPKYVTLTREREKIIKVLGI